MTSAPPPPVLIKQEAAETKLEAFSFGPLAAVKLELDAPTNPYKVARQGSHSAIAVKREDLENDYEQPWKDGTSGQKRSRSLAARPPLGDIMINIQPAAVASESAAAAAPLKPTSVAPAAADQQPEAEPADGLSDDDLCSVTSAEHNDFLRSVHEDPCTLRSSAASARVKGQFREDLKLHFQRLDQANQSSATFFDPLRAVRIHGYGGEIDVRSGGDLDGFSAREYQECQNADNGVVKHIVQYKRRVQTNEIVKTVISNQRFDFKMKKLTEWQAALKLHANNSRFRISRVEELAVANTIRRKLPLQTRIYPASPFSLEFYFAAPRDANPWLWTNDVEDCVVLIGLDQQHGAVLAHIPCFVQLAALDAQWNMHNLSRFSIMGLVTNQPSVFGERVLRALQRLRGAHAQPVFVDSPTHRMAQHKCLKRGNWRYTKQFLNPVGLNMEQLEQPPAREIAVNAATQLFYDILPPRAQQKQHA